MVLQISGAREDDVDEIASLHLLAFSSNPLLHAQFPTPASLGWLHSFLSQEMLSTIQDLHRSRKDVLVVRDLDADNQIISFAKWDLPDISRGVGSKVVWPEDCGIEYLDTYYERAEATKNRVLGDRPCYRLTFVGTLPKFQGQGAATMLVKWGIVQAKKAKVPIYLESTTAACSLYRRLGFVGLDGFSMTIPGNSLDGSPKIYEEVGMLGTWHDDDNTGIEYWDSSLNIESLFQDYEAGIKPQHVIQAIYDRIAAYKSIQPSVWVHLQPLGELMRSANELCIRWPDPLDRPPLWGVPFSVKDSIDIQGIPTTVGCPPLAFTPESSSRVYQLCIEAGGIFIGKVNMEQLATGLTGCRSPFGTLHSTFSKSHIVGGSTSGGAVTVSEGLVSFSIGSDTAGSIRVPALYNGLVGLKPTKGTVSARGVFPACLHQDCVSFLTTNVRDAERVWRVCKGFDPEDLFAKGFSQIPSAQISKNIKIRFGVPPPRALEACSPEYRNQFATAVEALQQAGCEMVSLDWTPFAAANELLYNHSFVTERLTILPEGWFAENKTLLHPVIRRVFEGAMARKSTAADLFRDLHAQAKYKRAVEGILKWHSDSSHYIDEVTVMVVPTAPFHPTIAEVEKDPIEINGRLGTFAHFANVLDLVGIAMPCSGYETEEIIEGKRTRLPFGVTILGHGGLDTALLGLAEHLEGVLRDAGAED